MNIYETPSSEIFTHGHGQGNSIEFIAMHAWQRNLCLHFSRKNMYKTKRVKLIQRWQSHQRFKNNKIIKTILLIPLTKFVITYTF